MKLFGPAVDLNTLPPAMPMIAAGKALTGAAQPYWYNGEQQPYMYDGEQHNSSNTWENVQALLDANGPALESTGPARRQRFRTTDFHPYQSAAFHDETTRLGPLIGAARWLSAAAVNDLHIGNGAAAVTNIRGLLALVWRGWENEQTGDAQGGRMSMAGFALNTTWEALAGDERTGAGTGTYRHAGGDWT